MPSFPSSIFYENVSLWQNETRKLLAKVSEKCSFKAFSPCGAGKYLFRKTRMILNIFDHVLIILLMCA